MDSLIDPWLQLGIKQMEVFDQNNEVYMQCLVAQPTLREIWRMVYTRAVIGKLLTPIEKVPMEVKTQLWTEAKEIAAGLLNHDETVTLSKALLTIKVFAGKL